MSDTSSSMAPTPSVAPTLSVAPALPAAGSSFYLGMRILPKEKREAMFAIYAFCRAVDDIADDGGPAEERRAGLVRWREDIDALYRGDVRPTTKVLAPHIQPFHLPRINFHEVIDGMQMDVDREIQAPDWTTLDIYCDRVASAVGRLSARVFGLSETNADALAHHLGRALQLTNILRDIDEDADIGRLYLPREALQRAGMSDLSPAAVLAHPGLDAACREVAERARHHYERADVIMRDQPRRLVRAPRLMEAAYGGVLKELLSRGFAAPRRPVKVRKARLLLILLRQVFA